MTRPRPQPRRRSEVKTFELHRDADETGISGTGVVAQGVIWTDGTVAIRWLTANRSGAYYDNIQDVERIHGHNGKTRIVMTPAAKEK